MRSDGEHQTTLLLRWALIIETAYLLLFEDPTHAGASPAVAIFLAAYLASNLIVAALLRRGPASPRLMKTIALFDAAVVSIALVATTSLPPFWRLVTSGALVQAFFLIGAAVFFGHLLERLRSAERSAEQARSNERLVSTAVEEVTRGFKTPLAAIQAISEILLEAPAESLSREHVELLRRIHTSSRHGSTIAASLLEASHDETDRLELDRTAADLSPIVAEALGVVTAAAELKGVSLDVQPAAPLPPALVDVAQIARAVLGLLDNAICSAPAGGEVFVGLDEGDREVVLYVSDDGPGVAPSELSAIFDKLRHVNGGFESSGFGLFVAKRIIEAHGGTIEADSEVGGGTMFTVRLPIVGSIAAPLALQPA